MEQFIITSHHIQSLTGGFVGLLFQALCSSIFAFEHRHVWGLLRASRDVLSARLGTENMSDPVLDQSSHHSCSVREDKMQTVTSGLLAGAAAASAKAQNPLQHLCYLCHHIISYVLLCYIPLTSLLLSFLYCRLQLKP